jgi:hypothetical protein
MRRRLAAIAASIAAIGAIAGASAYAWFFVIDRVVSVDPYYQPLPGGARGAVLWLRTFGSLTPWLSQTELRVIEADDGVRWTYGMDAPLYEIDFRAAGDDVVLLRERALLHAIELSSGEHLWTRPSPWPVSATYVTATALGDRVFAASDTEVRALDRATGATEWSVPLDSAQDPRPFGDRAITAGDHLLDAATGEELPLAGFSCRTRGSILACGPSGCARIRPDGSDARLAGPGAWDTFAFCFEHGDLFVAMIVRRVPGDPRDSFALARMDDAGDRDATVLAAWDARDRLVWARSIDSYREPCLLEDGRMKLTIVRGEDAAGQVIAHTRYYDLRTGEHEHCVGIDDCPNVISESWGLAPPRPGERACGTTRALRSDR